MIEGNFYYIDKTLLIQELFARRAEVTLLPRPRRFGKTLNLSMLYYFFSNTEYASHLFKNTAIERNNAIMETHQGKYPAIFLTFKDVKEVTWQSAYSAIALLIKKEFEKYHAILLPGMTKFEEQDYNAIMQRQADKIQLEQSYNMFVLGMIVMLNDAYEIRSNRESGYGRYDIMLVPKDLSKCGIVIEFKKAEKKENIEAALKEALNQIEEKNYAAELRARGVKTITAFGAAFKDKKVLVDQKNL